MRTFKEKQRVDRELFSELTESLVNPAVVFDALQCKLRRIGYVVLVLPPPVGKGLHRRVDYTVKKVNQASNGNIHREVRSKYWVCLSLNPDEIFREPEGVIEGLSKREK